MACTKLLADSQRAASMKQRSQYCSRRVQERDVAAYQACVIMNRQMRARGSCSTRSKAAARLHTHRRLQAGIDVALRSLPSRAKIEPQITRCDDTQKAAMCSAGTCCHRLAGGCDVARGSQRRRAPLVWCNVSLAPLTFTPRLSGCYWSIPRCRV
jgi:hypothetical protein